MGMMTNPAWTNWLNSAVNVLVSNEVKVVFDHGLKFSHFDDEVPEIVINCSADKWPLTMVHEYHHFCQWNEESEFWPEEDVESAIIGNPRNAKRKDIEVALACEKDCEERSLRTIQKVFPEDAARYCQAANAYLAFWNVIDKLGSWYKIPPYVVPEIVSAMPFDRITVVESKTLTEMIGEYCL